MGLFFAWALTASLAVAAIPYEKLRYYFPQPDASKTAYQQLELERKAASALKGKQVVLKGTLDDVFENLPPLNTPRYSPDNITPEESSDAEENSLARLLELREKARETARSPETPSGFFISLWGLVDEDVWYIRVTGFDPMKLRKSDEVTVVGEVVSTNVKKYEVRLSNYRIVKVERRVGGKKGRLVTVYEERGSAPVKPVANTHKIPSFDPSESQKVDTLMKSPSTTPLDETRSILQRIRPLYPAEAAQKGEEAEVRVRLFVTPEGTVSRVEVLSASVPEYFQRAATHALKQWQFTPLPSGRTEEQACETSINFKLD